MLCFCLPGLTEKQRPPYIRRGGLVKETPEWNGLTDERSGYYYIEPTEESGKPESSKGVGAVRRVRYGKTASR